MLSVTAADAQVHRLFPSPRTTNRSHACENELLTLTCEATGSRLEWTFSAIPDSQIRYTTADEISSPPMTLNNGGVTALLLNVIPLDGNRRSKFTSALFVNTSSFGSFPLRINCSTESGHLPHSITIAGKISAYCCYELP